MEINITLPQTLAKKITDETDIDYTGSLTLIDIESAFVNLLKLIDDMKEKLENQESEIEEKIKAKAEDEEFLREMAWERLMDIKHGI